MKKNETKDQTKQVRRDRVRYLLAWSVGIATTLGVVSAASAGIKLPRGIGD